MSLKKLVIVATLSFMNYASAGSVGAITIPTFSWSFANGKGSIKIDNATGVVALDGDICANSPDGRHDVAICGLALSVSVGTRNGYYLFSQGTQGSYSAQTAASAVNNLSGKIFSTSTFSPPPKDEVTGACIYFYRKTKSTTSYYNIAGACSGGYIPPAPSVVTCKFSGDVLIDYKSLSAEAASGAKKNGTTTISCDQDTAISLQVYDKSTSSNKVHLRDDKSLYATLTVNGADTSSEGVNINVKANEPSAITIDSELSTSGTPEAGEFTGSAIAVISIP